MIRYFVGIDGGGSKTRFLTVDAQGRQSPDVTMDGSYYRQSGIGHVISVLRGGLAQCVPAGTPAEEVAVCFGMPGYGDSGERDQAAAREIAVALAPSPVRFENDVAVGWAGALALAPGVVIVGGTGAMSYGRDASGRCARCGGWHEYFSDEGSGLWLGRQLLELFTKQSDGRLKKTALYELTRSRLHLGSDQELMELTEQRFSRSRKETAALQPILLEAARQGDPTALDCYRRAAEELALIAWGAVNQLRFPEGTVAVSHSGGLFAVKDLLLEPMQRSLTARLAPLRPMFRPPILSPCQGAVLLAAESFAPGRLKELQALLRAEA